MAPVDELFAEPRTVHPRPRRRGYLGISVPPPSKSSTSPAVPSRSAEPEGARRRPSSRSTTCRSRSNPARSWRWSASRAWSVARRPDRRRPHRSHARARSRSTTGCPLRRVHRPTAGSCNSLARPHAAALNRRHRIGHALEQPLRVHGLGDHRRARQSMVAAVLERVGLTTAHLLPSPSAVSGGELARVALARALLPAPVCSCSTSPPPVSTHVAPRTIVDLLLSLPTSSASPSSGPCTTSGLPAGSGTPPWSCGRAARRGRADGQGADRSRAAPTRGRGPAAPLPAHPCQVPVQS